MWLLENAVRLAIEQAQAVGVMPTADQQAHFAASRISAQFGDSSRLITFVSATAQIKIEGVLTNTPDFIAMLFGGGNTTYPEIINALVEADSDENIEDAELLINSPGGGVDGLFQTIDAINKFSKPIKATIIGVTASAAYIIASQADNITAINNASRIGSLGILWSTRIDENEISITSTNAPKKAPDVTTESGKAIVREELDALHDVMVDAISKGRNISSEKINANFGQGAVLLAGEALKRGMIDSIAKPQLKVVDSAETQTADDGGDTIEQVETMDLIELKAKHPDVYSAVVKIGTDDERDRVVAHLTMGESSGAMDTAITAIKEGSAMTVTLQAQYMSAGMNRADTTTRAEDDAAAAAALAGAGEGGEGSQDTVDEADMVAAGVEKAFGVASAV